MVIKITIEEYQRRADIAYGYDLSGNERDSRITTFLGSHSAIIFI
jgi:hypothetical protein